MYRNMIFFLMLLSCTQPSKETRAEIESLINSNKVTDIIKGFNKVGETKDTFFVKHVFINPADPRVSNNLKFKGISIYQAKMIAVKEITGVEPPVKITYIPDTSVINFYFLVAKKQQLLQ
jgi:hypothetical protein